MEIAPRDYREGDEHQILELFSEVFNRKMSLEVWKWRFVENPFGRGIIKLLFDGNKLIGHYAVIPMKVKIMDKVKDAVFSMTTMTHPNYRGRGIFPLLGEETYKEAAQRGFKFVFGFPNENSYDGFLRKLNWIGFGTMDIWQKRIENDKSVTNPVESKDIKEVDKFNNDVDLLWKKVRRDYSVIVPRTKPFLNWRFVQNPEVNYTKCTYTDGQGEISGYVILKIYRSKSETKGHIIDMLSINDRDIIQALLEYAYQNFRRQGITDISCWCPLNSFYAELLRKEGFSVAKMQRTYFGLKVFDKGVESLKVIKDLSNWYLTMGDSDVF